MPPAGTIALSNFLHSASGSSSRKRSHAEITRSQSRSVTPDHVPSKRRRINCQPTAEPSRGSTPPHPEPRTRFEGDGLDYRRPAMSAQGPSATEIPAPRDVTIDLTADSDSDSDNDSVATAPPESPRQQTSREPTRQIPHRREPRPVLVSSWREAAAEQRRRQQLQELARARRDTAPRRRPGVLRRGTTTEEPHQSRLRNEERRRDEEYMRAPPFGQRSQPPEVIDLSNTDESGSDTDDIEEGSVDTSALVSRSASTFSTSPEVEFVEERRVPRAQHHNGPNRPVRPGSAPSSSRSTRTPMGYFPDYVRRGTQYLFDNIQHLGQGYVENFNVRRDERARHGHDDGATLLINMDYRRPAFALGPFDVFDRSSETPQEVPEPYKGPPAAQEGFVRTFGEQDVILCPLCGDELAVGKRDTKKQVWVSKNCGHVYCGDCAVNRSKWRTSRRGKEKEVEQKPESSRSVPFTVCVVAGCNIKVGVKASMFPIYL